MLRLWLSRRWIVATLVALAFGVACFVLGSWQWSRHVEKRTKVTAIETNYSADPIPLEQALSSGPLTPERQWTRVAVTGTYAVDADLFARNRPQDKTQGYEVLTPVTTQEGRTLLVDRGWLPSGDSAAAVPVADPPPQGRVELTGWLRSAEVSLDRDLPPGQLASINVADARGQRPEVDPLDVYVVLGNQTPATPATATTPRPLPRPQEDLGPHQAYAIQWWVTMPAGLVFVVWAMRRELAPGNTGTPAPGAMGQAPVGRGARPRKVRIWDEEDA